MKKTISILSRNALSLLILLFLHPSSPQAAEDGLRKSLVKIFTTIQRPNYYEPWRVGSEENISGSGCVIAGNRILTNAHVVSDQIFIQVLKEGDTKKYIAKREFIAHDCDLAILKVEDPEFFAGTQPVQFGDLPFLRDKIAVYGFPMGGDELSITEGVVSRIELTFYTHSMRYLLSVQTDAAINPGNSGGPVFKDKKLVGIAFQAYNAVVAQNTGFLIPMPLIKRFLNEIKSGSYHSVPTLGLYAEDMENDSLRASFSMKPRQAGVLVSKVVYGSSAWGQVQENDVLTSIGGFPVANDGTILLRKGERVNFQYPLCLHRIGDKLDLKILRGGKPMALSVTLKEDSRLVPLAQYDVSPTYFIFDGIIFSPLTMNFPGLSGASELKTLFFEGLPSEDRKEVVVINHILPNEINKGYDSSYANLIVQKVNGHPIGSMGDLIKAFENPQDGRHIIEFDKPKEVGTRIVLDAAKSKKATAEILELSDIPSDRSPDLRDKEEIE